MNNLPTAKEFIEDINNKIFRTQEVVWTREQTAKWLIEFAKLHVQAALEAASKVKTKTHEEYISKTGEYEYTQVVDKQSILNSYNLENIK